MEVAAFTFVAFAVVLAAFQIGLAMGAPWGAAAYGGLHRGKLPRRLRAVSAVAGFGVYPFVVLFVVGAAGLAETGLGRGPSSRVWLWVLAGFFAAGTVMNVISRSKIERLWAPVSLILGVCCVVVANGIPSP
ncbi:MAG: hypothetical protein GTN62_04020 [Gemmatimonadales bacterium]|nr:hypothetical protein [Gemmatimonadales bacterium]NIP06729.1 hypothetical protein [Gemmatimonadales bacterium]